MSAFIYAALIVYKTLMYGDPVQGYPSLMVVVLFLGGTQLMFTGILGEYLGRVFNEVKQRPLYLLNDVQQSQLPPCGRDLGVSLSEAAGLQSATRRTN